MKLLDTLRRQLLKTRLLESGATVVIAVSGGPDSVALTHLLYRLAGQFRLTLVLAHFNHCLRGREAEEDARFVGELGRKLGLPVVFGRQEVKDLARSRGHGLQEAARHARYCFLERAAADAGASEIALGHNLEDQAETLLLRLFSGTGLRGLSGMAPSRPLSEGGTVRVVRPLLWTSRAEILEFLNSRNLAYRIDSSNSKTAYRRNRLRLVTIPHIQENYNSSVTGVLARTAERLRRDSEYLEEMARLSYRAALLPQTGVGKRLSFDLQRLREEPPALIVRVLARACRQIGRPGSDLESDHLEALQGLIDSEHPSGSLDLPGGVRVFREYARLVFEVSERAERLETVEIEIPSGEQTVFEIPGRALKLLANPVDSPPADSTDLARRAVVARGRISSGLALRTRRPGDWLGRADGGRKKLQDFLVQKKVPLRRRDELLIIADGSRVIWIPGLYFDRACMSGEGEPGLDLILEETHLG